MNNDDFTVLVSGAVMLLSEHVYRVAIAFKMTEQVKQQICNKFCITLEHSYAEIIELIRKAFRNNAMSAAQVKVWHKCFMAGNLLKMIHVLQGLQQAEHLEC